MSDFEELKSSVISLVSENDKAIKGLTRKGFQLSGDAMLELRVEILIESLLGSAEHRIDRLKFEQRYHEALKKILDRTVRDAEKIKREKESTDRLKKLHLPPGMHPRSDDNGGVT